MTVVELPSYETKARHCMSESEREAAIEKVAKDPGCGISLGSGIFKIRFAVGGRGKRGGVRVVYFFRNEGLPIFMLDVFAKNEKDNLSQSESNELAMLVKVLVADWLRGRK